MAAKRTETIFFPLAENTDQISRYGVDQDFIAGKYRGRNATQSGGVVGTGQIWLVCQRKVDLTGSEIIEAARGTRRIRPRAGPRNEQRRIIDTAILLNLIVILGPFNLCRAGAVIGFDRSR